MKALPHLSALAFPAALAILLGACASSNNEQRMEHRSSVSSSMPMHQGGMGSMGASGTDDADDASVRAMCDNNRRMMNARTEEERWALMEEPFRAMTPEMRERHLQLMRERCSAMR